ncbi:MAG: response regulator, partial [Armatimonadota bacterium]|nr:response regulator [Armatimonadota bacterium]
MANVLLVDDDGNVRLTLEIALRRRGHNVVVASDARQALLQLNNHHFAFLISDVCMPGMNGFELARWVRRLPNPPRIILTSAYSNLETQDDIIEALLPKPIDIARLHALLCSEPAALVDDKNGHSIGHANGYAEEARPSVEAPPLLRVAM